jgi:hypothetical protein
MSFRIPPWLVTTDQAQYLSKVPTLAMWREPCYAAIPSGIENFNRWPRIDSAECLLSTIEFVGVDGYDRDAYSIVFKRVRRSAMYRQQTTIVPLQ